MFEFYKAITDPDTGTEEIKKFRYEETDETLPLKEKLEKEVDRYEIRYITYVDRYYHCNVVEEWYPIRLSEAVFNNNDEFIGYMSDDVLYLKPYEEHPVCRDIRGATSIKSNLSIRRK